MEFCSSTNFYVVDLKWSCSVYAPECHKFVVCTLQGSSEGYIFVFIGIVWPLKYICRVLLKTVAISLIFLLFVSVVNKKRVLYWYAADKMS